MFCEYTVHCTLELWGTKFRDKYLKKFRNKIHKKNCRKVLGVHCTYRLVIKCSQRDFEETFENGQWRKVEQMVKGKKVVWVHCTGSCNKRLDWSIVWDQGLTNFLLSGKHSKEDDVSSQTQMMPDCLTGSALGTPGDQWARCWIALCWIIGLSLLITILCFIKVEMVFDLLLTLQWIVALSNHLTRGHVS